jgi:hypothetical protein
MGYYTDYKLEYKGDLDQETLITKLEEVSGYRWWDNYLTLPDVKWYEHDHHMEVISREYPDILFILTGEGEESGDVWRKYFKTVSRNMIELNFHFRNLMNLNWGK